MIIKYAEYNDEFEENLLSDMVRDLILTLLDYEWSEIIISTSDIYETCIVNNEDNKLYFEENYIKYITIDNICYLDYMSINRIDVKLQQDKRNTKKEDNNSKEEFNKEVEYNQWTGNRIIF